MDLRESRWSSTLCLSCPHLHKTNASAGTGPRPGCPRLRTSCGTDSRSSWRWTDGACPPIAALVEPATQAAKNLVITEPCIRRWKNQDDIDAALGFRNLTHYIARSLLEAGGFRPDLHPDCEEPSYA